MLKFVASVLILELEIHSATSVNVSWERLDTSLITGYIVYYRPMENDGEELNVSSSENFVIINNLITGVEYQFQVAVVAEVNGNMVMGERSNVSISRPTPPPATIAVTMDTGITTFYIE